MKNVWEEVCVQVQVEYSDYWGEYQNTIDNLAKNELAKEPDAVVELIC